MLVTVHRRYVHRDYLVCAWVCGSKCAIEGARDKQTNEQNPEMTKLLVRTTYAHTVARKVPGSYDTNVDTGHPFGTFGAVAIFYHSTLLLLRNEKQEEPLLVLHSGRQSLFV